MEIIQKLTYNLPAAGKQGRKPCHAVELLPKLVLGVPQRAVSAREELDPVETANGGSAVVTLKKMYDVPTELKAAGFT